LLKNETKHKSFVARYLTTPTKVELLSLPLARLILYGA